MTSATVVTPGVPFTSTGMAVTSTIVESYTTVCPTSTTFTVEGPKETATYTATPSETVTVSNGPFTTPVFVPTTAVITPTTPAAQEVATTAPAVPVVPVPVGTAASSGFGVAPKPSTTKPATFTGAANKLSGAGVAGLLGLAVLAL